MGHDFYTTKVYIKLRKKNDKNFKINTFLTMYHRLRHEGRNLVSRASVFVITLYSFFWENHYTFLHEISDDLLVFLEKANIFRKIGAMVLP